MSNGCYVELAADDWLERYEPTTPVAFSKDQHMCDVELDLDLLRSTRVEDERKAFVPVTSFIQSAFKDGRFVCKDVADWPDMGHIIDGHTGVRRGDLAVFATKTEDGQAFDMWQTPGFKPGRSCSPARRANATRNSSAHSVVLGFVHLDNPAFGTTPEDPFCFRNEVARAFRSNLVDYSSEIFLRQQRNYHIMFYIFRTTARFLRFDQTGVIVSKPIDLETDSEVFYKFFWSMANAEDCALGYDPTAKLIFDPPVGRHPDLVHLDEALARLPYSRTAPYILKAFLDDSLNLPIYKLQVPDLKNLRVSHYFLVRNPSCKNMGANATRGYIGFDVTAQRFCFVKDIWRFDWPEKLIEKDAYEELEPYHIRGIPTIHSGGDVLRHSPEGRIFHQTTQTQKHRHAIGFPRRVHARLVMNEIGIPLKDYNSSREMFSGFYHAFRAHRDAWEKAGIMHGDINEGNIMLWETPQGTMEGLLVDWELCKFAEHLEAEPTERQVERVGTFHTFSAALLRFPMKDFDIADDIEAFYHLLLLFTLRHHDHGLNKAQIRAFLLQYDGITFVNGSMVGGPTKWNNLVRGVLPCAMDPYNPFTIILQELTNVCAAHYGCYIRDWEMMAPYEPSQEDDTCGMPFEEYRESLIYESCYILDTCSRTLANHHAFLSTMRYFLREDLWWQQDVYRPPLNTFKDHEEALKRDPRSATRDAPQVLEGDNDSNAGPSERGTKRSRSYAEEEDVAHGQRGDFENGEEYRPAKRARMSSREYDRLPWYLFVYDFPLQR